MIQADSVLSTPRITASKPNPPDQPMTRDDELGMAWWNRLDERERARWSAVAGNTGRVKDAWEAFKRGSVDQTPPVDPTRRRFLAVAAVASVVSAGTLAAATAMDPSVPQAVTVPQASRALRDAIRALNHAHASLTIAQAANEEAEAIWNDWERQHPEPASKRGRRRWIRRADIERQALTSKPWQALMRAELVFATAQCEVALVPITGPADLHGMAVASAKYDRVELARGNRSPIGLMVATEIALGSAVLS